MCRCSRGALGLAGEVALLKGRANYLCRHRLELAAAAGLVARRRTRLRTGARADLALGGDHPSPAILPSSPTCPSSRRSGPLITSTRENCLGQECPQFARCHVFEARRAAQAADIVVVNHHLLLADLALKDEGFGDLLPGAEAVILDEAHQVPDIAAQFFGQTWSARQVQMLLRDAAAEMQRRRGARSGESPARWPRWSRCSTELRGGLPAGRRRRVTSGALPDCVRGRLAAARGGARRRRRAARGPGRRRRHRQLRAARGCARAARSRPSGDSSDEPGVRWVGAACRRVVAAIHALRNRRPAARIRRGAPLRLGVHLGDAGHRR